MKTNKWKLALLVWSAMFPFSTAISYGLVWLSFPADWPLVARTFCLTGMLVPFMIFGALPFLTRRFQRWLQMPDRPSNSRTGQATETTAAQPADPDHLGKNGRAALNGYPPLTIERG